jgi:site-specific recombinase XerD
MSSELRKKLIFELELRNRKERTITDYVQSIERLSKHFVLSPDKIEVIHIRYYQHYLLHGKKYAPNTVNRHMSAIRFFFRHVMHNYPILSAMPVVKCPKTLPVILDQQEVANMINSVHKVFYKAILMLMYSSGLRQGEVRNFKITDIDSKRNMIRVDQGKGSKDRYALLSPMALAALRTYWKLYRTNLPEHKQSKYLFIPTKNSYNGVFDQGLSHTAVGYMVETARKAAGIKKK